MPPTSSFAATTNVKKENGDRAVGTHLAADHPGQAMLRRGEAYKGPATLFGKKFMTAYFPVESGRKGRRHRLCRHCHGTARRHAVACDPDHGDCGGGAPAVSML